MIFNKFSAVRTDFDDTVMPSTFCQHQKVYAFIKKFIKNKLVLEIGSGNGYGAYKLSKHAKKILALDKDKLSIQKSNEKLRSKNLIFINSDIESFNSKEKFDVIIVLQTIEHIRDPKKLLKKIKSFLKDNGLVIISTPNRITQSFNENPYHYREYSPSEFKNLLLSNFKNVSLYGLFGDEIINEYETVRKKRVLKMLDIDKYKFRRLFPRLLKQCTFDIATIISRRGMKSSSKKNNFSERNYKIQKSTNKSIDLIAICVNE